MVRDWWNQLKQKGSSHYKGNTEGMNIQPIDLMYEGGGFRFWCTYNIMKYAFRQRTKETGGDKERLIKDIEKIKHYADLLLCSELEDINIKEDIKNKYEQNIGYFSSSGAKIPKI